MAIGAFAAPQQANAAAFVWVAGANFSYSAAACAAPPVAFYAWFLAVGPGATTFAWTACSGAFGGSASFAIARAGVGGAGAAFAGGLADPWAGIQTGTDISNFSDSSTFQGDSTGTGTEFTNPYSLSSTGITVDSNASDGELNGVDNLAAYLYTGSEDMTTLCGLFGGTDCSSSQSTQTGDITDLNSLATDLGLTSLVSWNDPSNLGGETLNFNTTVGNTNQIILVGQGDAASTPEPVSMALLGAGLCGLGSIRRRRKA